MICTYREPSIVTPETGTHIFRIERADLIIESRSGRPTLEVLARHRSGRLLGWPSRFWFHLPIAANSGDLFLALVAATRIRRFTTGQYDPTGRPIHEIDTADLIGCDFHATVDSVSLLSGRQGCVVTKIRSAS